MGNPWFPSSAAHVTVTQVLIEMRNNRLDMSAESERGSYVGLNGPDRGELVVIQPPCGVSFHIRSGYVSKHLALIANTVCTQRHTADPVSRPQGLPYPPGGFSFFGYDAPHCELFICAVMSPHWAQCKRWSTSLLAAVTVVSQVTRPVEVGFPLFLKFLRYREPTLSGIFLSTQILK